eukprot:SAG31_NODE_1173_length_9543_cov_8.654913_2_plen_54_part_00
MGARADAKSEMIITKFGSTKFSSLQPYRYSCNLLPNGTAVEPGSGAGTIRLPY